MTRFARFSKQSESPTSQHKIYNANQGKRIVIFRYIDCERREKS